MIRRVMIWPVMFLLRILTTILGGLLERVERLMERLMEPKTNNPDSFREKNVSPAWYRYPRIFWHSLPDLPMEAALWLCVWWERITKKPDSKVP